MTLHKVFARRLQDFNKNITEQQLDDMDKLKTVGELRKYTDEHGIKMLPSYYDLDDGTKLCQCCPDCASLTYSGETTLYNGSYYVTCRCGCFFDPFRYDS